MSRKSNRELSPRNGLTLFVGIVARISGCANQKELSLDDQVDHGKEVAAEEYEGPTEFITIATKGKGEALDRPELEEIEELLRSRKLDVLIMEDVGRLVRGSEAARLWGIAVDHGVRCIAPNDGCDTADDTWEEDVMEACASHLSHNSHTSRRLKNKLMNRFKKGLGATSLPISGYVKPEGAKTFDEWQKVETDTPIIKAGLDMLKATLNCSTVADYFQVVGFATGPFTRNKVWDRKMVRRFYKNPLLAGKPGRGFRETVKHHESGRRISVKNTKSEPTFLDYPHLMHVEYAELLAINCALAEANKCHSRHLTDGVDPLERRPKKRTRFPGQHARCWYCGRQCLWGGNGVPSTLMCSGSRDWNCWHSISFRGEVSASRLSAVVLDELTTLDGFDEQFAALVQLAGAEDELLRRRKMLEAKQHELTQQEQRLVDAVAELGLHAGLREKLATVKAECVSVGQQLRELDAVERQKLDTPRSAVELRDRLQEQFAQLACDSWQFGELMRQIVPEFYVYAVRLGNEGPLLPRAMVRLDLSGHIEEAEFQPEFKRLTKRWVTVDLFDRPLYETIRADVVRLAALHRSPTRIAEQLQDGVTERHVRKALTLHQKMLELGVEDPYVFVEMPPADLKKLKRHRHPRYRFIPLEGYERPPLMAA